MIFGEYIARLQRQVSRTDIGEDEYIDYGNRALKKIQQRRNWNIMKQSTSIIMPGGQQLIQMPGNYKCLQQGDAPVRVLYTNAGYNRPMPCKIYGKREFERLYAKFAYGVLSSYFRYEIIRLPIYIDESSGVYTLNIAFQAWESITFLIDYFGFLPRLANPDDTNWFLENYEEMVMAKAKAICWESVNDDLAAEEESIFDRELRTCVHDDSYRNLIGVSRRM